VLLAALLAPAAAPAAPGDLVVALGDSFSSGEGAPPFDPGTATSANTCHRSSKAWPAVLARKRKAQFKSFACSGAEIPEVLRGDPDSREPERRGAQLDDLRAQTSVDLVTLTIGGNDAGFANVLARCATPFTNCEDHYAAGGRNDLAADVAALAPRLRATYRVVRRAAPGADLLVLGYPRLFPREPARRTCVPFPLVSTIDAFEMRFLNARGRQLNAVVRKAAKATGARFADAGEAFEGHELKCGPDPRRMVNVVDALKISGQRYKYFFHPTELGFLRMAKLALPSWP
jgi:lysophospholipase L1-like esterase